MAVGDPRITREWLGCGVMGVKKQGDSQSWPPSTA